ncbi:hypothetical protein [Streptomyces sp. NPDC020965]|uniref:hypothetical protein n=1 Tax=Streptomyces sp. NPDC020965 TaxID=3365105 RepID=UPI0037AC4ED2
MDVEEVAGALYALRPDEFIAERAVCIARARREGDREAVRRIAALRKPVLAAWSANLLSRHDRDATERFLKLGTDLREAQQGLDGAALRELGHDRHRVTAALASQAADLALDAGQPIAETVRHEVEQILHAVLIDPETAARWAAGRMVSVPQAVGGFATMDPALADGRHNRPPAPEPDEPGTTRAAKRHQEDRADRRQDEARRASAEAQAETGRREKALELAQTERTRAEAVETAAIARVRDLEE